MPKRKYSATALVAYKRPRKSVPRIPRNLKGFVRYGGAWNRFGGASRGKELKFLDTACSGDLDNTLEVLTTGQCCLIPQGAEEDQRVGRSCIIKSIYIKGRAIYQPGASATAGASGYLWLVQDTQANGAAATAANVFDGTTAHDAMTNLDNSLRFRILKYWSFDMNSPAGVSTAYNVVHKTLTPFYKKCHIPLEFSGATGAITELRSNNLFFVAGSSGSVSDDLVSVNLTCRIRFSDQ